MPGIFEEHERELEEATKKELQKEAAAWAALPVLEQERLSKEREALYEAFFEGFVEDDDNVEEDADEYCED